MFLCSNAVPQKHVLDHIQISDAGVGRGVPQIPETLSLRQVHSSCTQLMFLISS